MNTYKATIKLSITKTITKNVEVQATDSERAKLQLEVIYGKGSLVSSPKLTYTKR